MRSLSMVAFTWTLPAAASAVALLGVCPAAIAVAEEPAAAGKAEVSAASRLPGGVLVHTVRSEYQAGTTSIKVLLPDSLKEGKRYRAVYVLPVEAGEGTHWGDALEEVRKHDLPNRHELVFVYPTFSHLPWYADHPTNPHIRQESYFLNVVVPFVERTYPVTAEPKGRLLVGFSKSGWGAFSLLLRHPDRFAKAAAWDAPLTEARPERFGMNPIFGTQENFEKYRIEALLEARAGLLRGREARLVLTGYGGFRAAHMAAHERLVALEIPHRYRDGPPRKHEWHSGWLPEAVGLLLSPE